MTTQTLNGWTNGTSSTRTLKAVPQLNDELIEKLRRVPLFARWLDEGVECLQYLSQAEEIHLQPGETLVPEGGPAGFYLLLEGDLRVLKKVGSAEMLLTTHRQGAFFGEIPMILDTPFVAGGQAATPCVVLRVHDDAFWKMLQSCPQVMREITKTMATRLQNLESVSQTREKLVSLGTLAAGLAHELNNPASAAQRAAKNLRETQHEVENRALALHGLGLAPQQCHLISQSREHALEAAKLAQTRAHEMSPMERADREDTIADWLDSHDMGDAFSLAPTFVNADVSVEWLDQLAGEVSCETLEAILQWLEASLRMDALTLEVEQSVEHISSLVGTVKEYSHLDRAPQQSVDVHAGLEATLVMLKHKLRGIAIERSFDRTLPPFLAYGSELNQVWTNLLDNASDALKNTHGDPKRGAKISLQTSRDGNCAVVQIADNGSGIPAELKSRIFEPFFTTKDVGSGTGLGLDIVHRIVVGRHGGDILLDSNEHGTTFTVRLPLDRATK